MKTDEKKQTKKGCDVTRWAWVHDGGMRHCDSLWAIEMGKQSRAERGSMSWGDVMNQISHMGFHENKFQVFLYDEIRYGS